MSVLAPEVARFLDEQPVGSLVTRSALGRVHQSLVYFVRDGEELAISTAVERRKALDVQETGWASLCVMGHERPFPSVTVAGPAELRVAGIGGPTARIAQRMLDLDTVPEEQSDEALTAVGRGIIALQIERVGPTSYIDGTASS